MTPHPRTPGVYGSSRHFSTGTNAADNCTSERSMSLEKLDPKELGQRPKRRAAVDSAGTIASLWIDIDATITRTDRYPRSVGYRGSCRPSLKAVEAWRRKSWLRDNVSYYRVRDRCGVPTIDPLMNGSARF
jgi:hypothetical protein